MGAQATASGRPCPQLGTPGEARAQGRLAQTGIHSDEKRLKILYIFHLWQHTEPATANDGMEDDGHVDEEKEVEGENKQSRKKNKKKTLRKGRETKPMETRLKMNIKYSMNTKYPPPLVTFVLGTIILSSFSVPMIVLTSIKPRSRPVYPLSLSF